MSARTFHTVGNDSQGTFSICYMCAAPATSDEHVPPRCLFPAQKDIPSGVDLRKQLISVPSCDAHNGKKSKDDEYLLLALLMNISNNQTAQNHALTKVRRSVKRNPSLMRRFSKMQRAVHVPDTWTGQIYPTVAIQTEEKRLKTSLEMVGRALYRHHFQTSWQGSVSAYPHFLVWLTEANARELNKPNAEMEATAEKLVQAEPMHGENPEVFCYQVALGKLPAETIMLLRFYKGAKVTLFFRID